MENNDRCCKTCVYHDDWTWVCFNPDSESRADFTNEKFVCNCWESREDKNRDAEKH